MQVRRHWIFWTLQILVVFLAAPSGCVSWKPAGWQEFSSEICPSRSPGKNLQGASVSVGIETCNGFVLPVCVAEAGRGER